jgi:hypothetical protein
VGWLCSSRDDSVPVGASLGLQQRDVLELRGNQLTPSTSSSATCTSSTSV